MKKYTSTIRLVNTVIFGLLFAGFACLAIFFSFLFAPKVISPSYLSGINYAPTGKAYAFVALLGVTGLAMAFISLGGLITSIRSLLHEGDDKLVVKSFCSYIALGYATSLFFFFNALWLFNQIGGETVAFWIILSVILCIGCLIATNVPMMKLLEDKDPNIISSVLNGTMFAIFVPLFVTFAWTTVITNVQNEGGKDRLRIVLYVLDAITLIGSVVSCIGWRKFAKNEKLGKTNEKLSAFTWSSFGLLGTLPLAAGILETILNYVTRRLPQNRLEAS